MFRILKQCSHKTIPPQWNVFSITKLTASTPVYPTYILHREKSNDVKEKINTNFDNIATKFSAFSNEKIDIKMLTEEAAKSLKDIKQTPKTAFGLGTAITLPVLLPPLMALAIGSFSPALTTFQVAYTACAIPYLIGQGSGFQLSRVKNTQNFPTGESLSLNEWAKTGIPIGLGFAGLLCLQVPAVSVLLAGGGLAASMYTEIVNRPFSGWFMANRLLFSGLAIMSLGGTFLLYWILPHRSRKRTVVNKN